MTTAAAMPLSYSAFSWAVVAPWYVPLSLYQASIDGIVSRMSDWAARRLNTRILISSRF